MGWACVECGRGNPSDTRFCGHCGTPRDGAPTDDALVDRLARGQVPERPHGGVPRDERRLVTALFADISGFTALADRVDAEHLAEIIAAIIAELSDIVGHYEGYIDKYSGDALLALFGAPTSHEDDVIRAISSAEDMHRRLTELKPGLGPAADDLALHIGVNTGHAIALVLNNRVRTDYSVLGDAINVAQRLESLAGPGETYVGGMTERASRHEFAFEPLGPLALKGKSAPVAAFRLLGRRVGSELEAPFVGRHAEREVLRRALARLVEGSGGLVVVEGSAGSGKTALVASMRAEVAASPIRWIESRAVSYRAGSPYAPVIELLTAVVDETSDTAAARVLPDRLAGLGLGEHAPALLGLLRPDWSDDLDPETRRMRIHTAVRELLTALAAREALVWEIEDLQWADPATVELVATLLDDADRRRLLMIVTTRTEADAPPGRDLAALAPEGTPAGSVTRITLAPLTDDEVLELVRRVRPNVTDAVAANVLARAAGNPFFAAELTRSVIGEHAPVDGSLPPSIEAALSARLDRLSDDASRLLDVAAAIGTEIPEELLASLAQASAPAAGALDELFGARILVHPPGRPGVVAFEHALLQEVAYARMLRRHAREVHGRIADEVERLFGSDGESGDVLAYHLYAADRGVHAVDQLLRSARRAASMFANDTAMLHLRRARELCARHHGLDGELDAATFELADLELLVGAYEAAAGLYRTLLDRHGGDRAVCGLAASLRNLGRYDDALDALDAGDGRTRTSVGAHRLLERGRCLMMTESFDAAIETFGHALDRAGADDALRGSVLCDLARAESSVGRLALALDHALAARDAFRTSDDHRQLVSALRVLGGVYEDLGRLDEAAVALHEGLALAEHTGFAQEIGGCLVNLGLVELARGEITAAIEHDRRAVEELRRIGHPALATAYANLAEALLADGSLGEALRLCERAMGLARGRRDLLTLADAGLTAALVHLRSGDGDRAAEAAEAAAVHFEEVGAHAWADRARAVAAEGRADGAIGHPSGGTPGPLSGTSGRQPRAGTA